MAGSGVLRIAAAVCVSALVVLTLVHAQRAEYYAADDLTWLAHASKGLGLVWTRPSPFGHFRPVFGTWLAALRAIGADSPAGLAVAGLILSLAIAALARWAFECVLPAPGAIVASVLLLIHPARQEHLLWASAQTDALCLALSLLCIGLTLRSPSGGAITLWRLRGVAVTTALAVLSKEIALLLPILLAALPRDLSGRERLRLGRASFAGAAGSCEVGGRLRAPARGGGRNVTAPLWLRSRCEDGALPDRLRRPRLCAGSDVRAARAEAPRGRAPLRPAGRPPLGWERVCSDRDGAVESRQ